MSSSYRGWIVTGSIATLSDATHRVVFTPIVATRPLSSPDSESLPALGLWTMSDLQQVHRYGRRSPAKQPGGDIIDCRGVRIVTADDGRTRITITFGE